MSKEIYLLIEGLHKQDRGTIWGFTEDKEKANKWKTSKASDSCYVRYYNRVKNIDHMFDEKPKLSYWIQVNTTVKTEQPASVYYKDNKPYLYGYEYTVITDDVNKIEEYFKKKFSDVVIARIRQISPQHGAWMGSEVIRIKE